MEENSFDFHGLKEVDEYKCILLLYEEAATFLESQKWCNRVVKGWHKKDLSIYEKLGVFLFEIEPSNETVDTYVWIILGDIPTVYLDQSVTNGEAALTIYCQLMNEWSDSILNGQSLEECYPVDVEPTTDNARLLQSKIAFVKKEILLQTD